MYTLYLFPLLEIDDCRKMVTVTIHPLAAGMGTFGVSFVFSLLLKHKISLENFV